MFKAGIFPACSTAQVSRKLNWLQNGSQVLTRLLSLTRPQWGILWGPQRNKPSKFDEVLTAYFLTFKPGMRSTIFSRWVHYILDVYRWQHCAMQHPLPSMFDVVPLQLSVQYLSVHNGVIQARTPPCYLSSCQGRAQNGLAKSTSIILILDAEDTTTLSMHSYQPRQFCLQGVLTGFLVLVNYEGGTDG